MNQTTITQGNSAYGYGLPVGPVSGEATFVEGGTPMLPETGTPDPVTRTDAPVSIGCPERRDTERMTVHIYLPDGNRITVEHVREVEFQEVHSCIVGASLTPYRVLYVNSRNVPVVLVEPE